MIRRFIKNIDNLTDTKNKIYIIFLIPVLLITLRAVILLSYNNFQIFSFGSLDFWNGNNPYTNWNHLSLLGKPLDVFLYSPLFSILFIPFALLPGWLGLLCWNLFTYTLFYLSVFSLPEQFTFEKKKFIFFYSALLLLQTIYSDQFNPVVAASFLFSFTLLEKKKGFWAILIILLSGFTKIYGIFQIGMLLFYPKFWKNILYTFTIGTILLLLPLVKVPLDMLSDYYQSWIKLVINHSEPLRFDIIYRPIYLLCNSIEPFMVIISLGVIVLLYSIVLVKLKLFKESFFHRVKFLGILMSWAILFGTASERNTYIIAFAGYAMWYLSSQTTNTDKGLLWINFILLGIIPIDLFFPKPAAIFLLDTLNSGIIVFAITWGIMSYKTFVSGSKPYSYSST